VESGRRRNYYTDPAEDALLMSMALAGSAGENIASGKTLGESI